MAETMKAWICATPGAIGKTLKLVEDAPKPPAKPLQDGQILVEVGCAGINPADYKSMELGVASRALNQFPKIPGMDLSGRVVDVASDVTDTKPGDFVAGRVTTGRHDGSLAQYAVLNREGYATLPKDFDLQQAAGLGTAAMTAYQTIAPHVKAGDRVFLNGGSGGVGTFGIQIAKALGCHVTVSCSTAKANMCKELGADEVIDYKTTKVTSALNQGGQVFKLVVDNVSNSPPDLYSSSHHFLLPDGQFVLVGGAVSFSSATSIARSLILPSFLGGGKRKFSLYLVKNDKADLQQLVQWVAEGKVRTVVDSVYGFNETPQAFEHLRGGSCAGKVIVRVRDA